MVASRLRAHVLCAALTLAPLATAGAETATISDGVVRIGVLTDMTGPFSDLGGPGSVTATQMAIDDFVAQAKPSFKIEVVTADHQNKPDIGAGIARQWYDSGVDMITDAINSGVALAVSGIAESKNRMLIVSGSGSTRLTNEQCSPNTVSYTWDTYSVVRAQARIVKALGLDSWYFLAVDYALGKSLVAEATAAVTESGGKVAGAVYHPIGATDFSSFLLQAQGSNANVIGLATAGNDMLNAMRAAKEFNVSQKLVPLVGTITEINALGAETTQGAIFVENFYWDANEASRAWSNRFFTKTGKMPNSVQAGAYSAVLTYLKAVQGAGSDDAGAVMKQMKAWKIDDAFTRNGYIREDGRMVHDLYLVEVKKPSAMTGKWDYYNVREVVPGDEAFQPLSTSRCKLVMK